MVAELAPIDVREIPGLARLAEEVRATRRPRRLMRGDEEIAVLVPAFPGAKRSRRRAPQPLPPIDQIDPVLAELDRRRRLGMNYADMTAGILKDYAKHPPPTPREEKDAFEQAVVDEVMGETGD